MSTLPEFRGLKFCVHKPLQILDGSSKHMTFKVFGNWDDETFRVKGPQKRKNETRDG